MPDNPWWGGFTLRGEKLHLVVDSKLTPQSACGRSLPGGAWRFPKDQLDRTARCSRCLVAEESDSA